MAGPFYNNVSGTVTAAPGTGAFTPTAAASGGLAWSTVPANQIVSYRADEGTTWEMGVGFWNGTTLSRTMEFSSTGALINFGTGVVVSDTINADEVQPHMAGGTWFIMSGNQGVASNSSPGAVASSPNSLGTIGAATIATTNAATRLRGSLNTSAATVNANCGYAYPVGTAGFYHQSVIPGGWEVSATFGFTAIPTAPRLMVGATASPAALAAEPSTINNTAAFIKDSTDTNIQFACRSATAVTKVDTGIPLVVGAVYETTVWSNPGQPGTVWGCILRKDTGAVYVGKITTNTPVVDTIIAPVLIGGLSAAATAMVMKFMTLFLRTHF